MFPHPWFKWETNERKPCCSWTVRLFNANGEKE